MWPLLEKAILSYGPTHEKHHVWEEIEAGRAQFWPGTQSAIVTRVNIYPTGLKELWWWLAAGKLRELRKMKPFIEAWAREDGCDRAGSAWTPGFSSVFRDYRTVKSIAVKDL